MTDNSFYIFVDSNLRDFGDNNNFRFYLPNTKIVTKKYTIQIINLTFPSGFIDLTVSNKRLIDSRFTILIYDDHVNNLLYKAPVSEGTYTPQQLCTALTNTINDYVAYMSGQSTINFFYDETYQTIKCKISHASSALISLQDTYSVNDILGLDRKTTTTTTYTVERDIYKYFPNVVNCLQLPYNYLVCPQITNKNIVKNLGGNAILCKIEHTNIQKNSYSQFNANDTTFYNYECEGQIPSFLDFRIVDELGNIQQMNFNLNYNFVLKITPIE